MYVKRPKLQKATVALERIEEIAYKKSSIGVRQALPGERSREKLCGWRATSTARREMVKEFVCVGELRARMQQKYFTKMTIFPILRVICL